MTDTANITKQVQYTIGQVVRHKHFSFRGVIVDVDAEFSNTEEWWLAIPKEYRPSKEQPFYHLLAENSEDSYEAYVSQQNLIPDDTGEPVKHPDIIDLFDNFAGDHYTISRIHKH